MQKAVSASHSLTDPMSPWVSAMIQEHKTFKRIEMASIIHHTPLKYLPGITPFHPTRITTHPSPNPLRRARASRLARLSRRNPQRLLNVIDAERLGNVGEEAAGGLVEEVVDLVDAETLEELADSLADGLEEAGLGALVAEAEELLGEGDAEGLLELFLCQR